MTGVSYFQQLSPEICLVAGACVVWLVGVSKSAVTRSMMAPFALLVLIGSMVCTARYGQVVGDEQAAGLLFGELSYYVRWSTLIIGVLLLLVNWRVPADREQGEFFGMMLCSLAGLMLTGSANDLVILFLALELVSVPTYVLVALSRTDSRASEAAVKYFFLGALAAAVLAYGFSFLFGLAGTTVLTSVSGDSLWAYFGGNGAMSTFALIGMVLAFGGLSFKVAAVPFHAYVADVYEGAASPVTGLLGFLPKAAGFVAMVKLMAMCHWQLPDSLMWMLWGVAAVTMTVGNVLALLQKNVKRMLAYSSIAHSGYMLVGLLVGPARDESHGSGGPMRDGVAAMLFYIVVYGAMNLGAFAVLANLRIKGRAVETLDDLAGLSRRAPLLALAMAVCVFSLMGFPPTAGFMGKVYLFWGAFSTGEQALVVLAVLGVVNSAIAAAYYLRIVAACYMREPAAEVVGEGGWAMRLALAVCSVAMIVLFIRPTEVVRHAQTATRGMAVVSAPSLAETDQGTLEGAARRPVDAAR